jgi:hypothetical protein
MTHFVLGAVVMASAVAGLLFLQSWRDTRDRFFGLFALAFWVLAVNWAGIAIYSEPNEVRSFFYLVRWLAFCLIILAIVDKNRQPPPRDPSR